MENLNAEQVKKALECWASGKPCEGGVCDLFDASTFTCDRWTGKNALALINSQEQRIKELAAENERLKAQKYYIHSDGRIEMIPTVESVRADTVRKMQERLKGRNEVYCINKSDLKVMNFVVDQIAKEMLEGEK